MIKTTAKIYRAEKEFFFRSLSRIFMVLALVYFLSAAGGLVLSLNNPSSTQAAYDSIKASFESKGFFKTSDNFQLFILIFLNNALAGFLSLLSGIVPFAFLSFWAVVGNGFLLGVVGAASFFLKKEPLMTLLSLFPHGIVELPAFFYAASLGVYLSVAVAGRITGKGKIPVIGALKLAMRSFFLVALPLFLLAALLEAYVTYAIVSK